MRLLSLKIKNLLSLETTNQYSNCIFLAYVFMGAEFLYFRSGGGFLWGRRGKIYDTKCYSWLGDGGCRGYSICGSSLILLNIGSDFWKQNIRTKYFVK